MFVPNNKKKVKANSSYKLLCKNRLTSAEATVIRCEIESIIKKEWQTIYIDTREVVDIDLSGINEIIHTSYYLARSSKELILVYRKKSPIAKWIEITSLHRFIKTAQLPESA